MSAGWINLHHLLENHDEAEMVQKQTCRLRIVSDKMLGTCHNGQQRAQENLAVPLNSTWCWAQVLDRAVNEISRKFHTLRRGQYAKLIGFSI